MDYKKLENYSNYIVSINGDVYSCVNSKPSSAKEYIISSEGSIYFKLQGLDNGGGYRMYRLKDDQSNSRWVLGHRASYTAWFGEIPEKMQVHHIDHNRSNNAPSNLECVTPSQNQKLAYQFRKKII